MSTSTSATLARFGALVADPTRAELLCALMDGRAHTGSELARHLGVAASTASEHLSKLLDGAMVTVEPQGRHRYFRLASAEIAGLLETLGSNVAPPGPPKAPAALLYARTCYDHLAGAVAVAIYGAMCEAGHLVDAGDHMVLTDAGLAFLGDLGAETSSITASRRPRAKRCLDWTERRHHLAGSAGAAVLQILTERGWVSPGVQPRSMQLTETGRRDIPEAFGLSELPTVT